MAIIKIAGKKKLFEKFDDRTKEWFFPNGQLEELKSLFETFGEEVIEEAIIERLSVTLKNSRAFPNLEENFICD